MTDFDPTFAQYEEDSAATRVYKTDHEPLDDGAWHAMDSDGTARYRVVGDRFQYLNVQAEPADESQRELVRFLEGLEPLLDDNVIEVWAGCDDHGFFLRDYRWETNGPLAVRLGELTPDAMRRALVEIHEKSLEDD